MNCYERAIVFMCVFSCVSCLDTIDLDLPGKSSGRMVIEGVVERSADNYRFLVSARRTQNLVADTATHLEHAVIYVLLNGTPVLELKNGKDSLISVDAFNNQYGVGLDDLFNIEVQTQDGLFRSDDQFIWQSSGSSEVHIGVETREALNEIGNSVDQDFVKVYVSNELVNSAGRKVSALYSIRGVFQFREVSCTDSPSEEVEVCYIRDPFEFNQVNVLNGRAVSGDRITGFEIGETAADFRFSSAYYFTILKRSIDHDVAEYWEEVKKSINREGTIFDTPVGAVQTNIDQIEGAQVDVLGYFYTASVDTMRHLSPWAETGKQPNGCSAPTFGCCNCLEFRNSSLEKPSY